MESIKTNYDKFVRLWLLTSIILVFTMIIIGGLTRLTDSGLSITQWELFKGIFPPFNNDKWLLYFSLYREIPQFKLLNPDMTLKEFKVIFYWEYFHRLFGRIIGIFYLIPLIIFTYKKVLDIKILWNLYFIFFMILVQGFLGWYMVESGLVNNVTVSHYRLSAHLLFAFLIISLLFWNYLNYSNNIKKKFFSSNNKLIITLYILILLQILFGAFVSGLDAGLIYQTWPKMNLSYFPDDINFVDLNFFSYFNNESFVQFIHRSMAYVIIIFTFLLFFKMYFQKEKKFLNSFYLVIIVLLIQVSLGILTLISGLHLYLASLHQITSVILILTVLNLNHKLS